MAVEIVETETLSAEQWQKLFGWGKDIFGAEDSKLCWRPKELHFLLYDEGKLVSHVGVLKHTVLARKIPVTVGGVGGVVTVPEAQKKGFAAILMRRVHEFFEHEWKTEAGLLFCLPRMIRYYESLGWRVVEETILVEQSDGSIESPIGIMVLPFGDEWPQGTIELKSFPW